jgi:hypothetical protein
VGENIVLDVGDEGVGAGGVDMVKELKEELEQELLIVMHK